jgi:hypothetical protein
MEIPSLRIGLSLTLTATASGGLKSPGIFACE